MTLPSSFGASQLAAVVWIVQLVGVSSLPTGDGLSCPRLCFCNAPSRIVYCSRRGLATIPVGIPVNSLQLNLNGNVFESPVMRRVNLSSFVELEHLYISECRLETLEVGAFADLIALRWLDLSNNRLRAIAPDTFHGLQLQHLFLNGNRHVQLSAGSFNGLLTVGLYLHDCSLADISPHLLAPLNSTLRYLWLNGNDLDRLDARLADSFASLHHLRLGSNPLRCDCGVAWLRSFFDDHIEAFRGALPPSCYRPPRLRGHRLGDVDPANLRCRPPSFTELEVLFDAPALSGKRNTRRRLLCAAVGDPMPTVYWIQPSGKTTRYERPTRNDADVEQVEAVLELTSGIDDEEDASISGLYTCIANNNIGNVTLTVVVPAQRHPPTVLRLPTAATSSPDSNDRHRLDGRTTTTMMMMLPASTPAILQSILLGDSLLQLQRLAASNAPSPPPYSLIATGQQNRSTDDRAQYDQQVPVASSRARFSSAEMACAVVVTHICTLLLCIAVVILHRSRRRLGLAALAGKRRYRQRRFSFPGDSGGSGVLRAAYERRLPWSGARRPAGYTGDEKAVMSLDRATSATAAETVAFKRGVRQYTLNDYYADPNDVR